MRNFIQSRHLQDSLFLATSSFFRHCLDVPWWLPFRRLQNAFFGWPRRFQNSSSNADQRVIPLDFQPVFLFRWTGGCFLHCGCYCQWNWIFNHDHSFHERTQCWESKNGVSCVHCLSSDTLHGLGTRPCVYHLKENSNAKNWFKCVGCQAIPCCL